MAIYIKEGEIIEGKKADVIARRAEWKGLKEEPITGKKMTLYELDRNSSVEITEALELNKRTRKYEKISTSMAMWVTRYKAMPSGFGLTPKEIL